MPFTADTYRVMIASPSDLGKERTAATLAIHDWNDLHAADESVVLLPVKWETHATPSAGSRPQAGINEDLVTPSDILVVLFWARLGSNTGIAASGTVEELTQFLDAGKPVLIYTSRRPVQVPKDRGDIVQIEKLRTFINSMYSKALVFDFRSGSELRQMLPTHLMRVVRKLRSIKPSSPTAEAAAVTPHFFPITKHTSTPQRQIIACVADIRSFNRFAHSADMTSGRPDELLITFFSSLNAAFIDAMRNISENSDFQNEISVSALPTVTKTLGDGALIVWEFSETYKKPEFEMGLVLFVLDFVRSLQDHFYSALAELGRDRSHIPHFGDLHLSIGISSGRAWKVSGLGTDADFVGTAVSEAFRLQELVRPYGVIANLLLRPHLFMERCCALDGRICRADIDRNHSISVWASVTRPTIHRRWPRRPNTLEGAQELVSPPDDSRPSPLPDAVPLTKDDTVCVFDVRKRFEAGFAADLARRVKLKQVSIEKLRELEVPLEEAEKILKTEYLDDFTPPPGFQQRGTEFHSLIAEMSDETESHKRKEIVRLLYDFTKHMYHAASVALHKALAEHRGILEAIKRGHADEARELMEKHLEDHYELAKDNLLKNPPGSLDQRR